MYMNCSFKNESHPTAVGFCSKTSVRKIRKSNNSHASNLISDLYIVGNNIDVYI